MIKIKDSLHREIKILSAHMGCTMREFAEKVLSEYIEKHEIRKEVSGKDKLAMAK